MKINTNKLMLIVMLIVFILTIFFQFFWLKEGTSCMNNPLVYGVDKYTKSNNAEVNCVCSVAILNSPMIYVNSTDISVLSESEELFE